MPAGLANMEAHTARASGCGYGEIKAGSKAEQLTRSANVEDEAGKLMARVSICAELNARLVEDDNRCSFLDTCRTRRLFFEAM